MIVKNYKNNDEVIVYTNGSINFRQLLDSVKQYTSTLIKLGIKRGDRITILSDNNPEFITLLFSLWNLKAIPIPVNYKLHENDIIELHNSVKSKLILLHRNIKSKLEKPRIIKFPFKSSELETKTYHYKLELNPEDAALIMFTSGTTSKPRGVVLTFENLINSAKNISQEFSFDNKDRFLASLPFFHIGGFSIILRALLNGGKIILLSSLNTEDILRSLKETNPTIISVVPTMLKRMIDNNVRPNSALRIVFLGGGPSQTGLIKSAFENGWPIVKVYGSTETASMIAYKQINNMDDITSGAKPIGDSEFIVESEKKEILNKNQVGEIVIKGKTIAKEYFNDEIMSSQKFVGGKYYTSDLGYIDDKNELHILGRKDDIIISGGENINPHKIEQAILLHPDILEVAVIGKEDREWGQKVVALLVKDNSSKLTKIELKDFLKNKIANFEIPKEFIFVEHLPKNELGKIKKNELKNFFHSDNRLF